jgi:hypothetical protein
VAFWCVRDRGFWQAPAISESAVWVLSPTRFSARYTTVDVRTGMLEER